MSLVAGEVTVDTGVGSERLTGTGCAEPPSYSYEAEDAKDYFKSLSDCESITD